MTYTLNLKAKIKNHKKFLKAIEKETSIMDRSSLAIEDKQDYIQFKVQASDVVALKATINIVIKIPIQVIINV